MAPEFGKLLETVNREQNGTERKVYFLLLSVTERLFHEERSGYDIRYMVYNRSSGKGNGLRSRRETAKQTTSGVEWNVC